MNASTFDFLSSSSIDVNGKWSDSSWIIFAPILKFVGLILCTTIPPTLHLVVHTWLWGFVSVVSAIPFTAGKFIWMILLGIRCWQRMKGDQPQTVRGNNLQQRRVYNLLKKSLLYRSNQINLSILDKDGCANSGKPLCNVWPCKSMMTSKLSVRNLDAAFTGLYVSPRSTNLSRSVSDTFRRHHESPEPRE